MLFTQDRTKSRQMFVQCWKKFSNNEAMEPLEKQIADIVAEHPEYHALLASHQSDVERDFSPEDGLVNPFLHMGMHLALREQVGTDRPNGIATITRSLLLKYSDGHQVEHMMMECLGEMLWSSQRNNTPPDEIAYLEALHRLKNKQYHAPAARN